MNIVIERAAALFVSSQLIEERQMAGATLQNIDVSVFSQPRGDDQGRLHVLVSKFYVVEVGNVDAAECDIPETESRQSRCFGPCGQSCPPCEPIRGNLL